MSFLTRTAPRFTISAAGAARPVATRIGGIQQQRTFSSSSVRMLKESDRHVEGQDAKNELHKQDSLQKQKDGKGHWKPELASDSEEAVAADRHVGTDHKDFKDLQDKTAHHAKEKHE